MKRKNHIMSTSTAAVTAVITMASGTSLASPVSSQAVDETTETKSTPCSCYCHIESESTHYFYNIQYDIL